MVAESASPPKSPGKMARKSSVFSPGCQIPLAIKLTVRSLYLVQGQGIAQIWPLVGLTYQQVKNMVAREGWSKERNAPGKLKPESEKSQVEELQLAHAQAEVKRIHESIAIRTEELSVRTLDHCSEILDKRPADMDKALQMASGAARNFVQIARMSRGLDARRSESAGNDGAPSVNVFLVRGETLERPMVRAEVVTEVEVKTIPNA